jgi:hypothetical protein
MAVTYQRGTSAAALLARANTRARLEMITLTKFESNGYLNETSYLGFLIY